MKQKRQEIDLTTSARKTKKKDVTVGQAKQVEIRRALRIQEMKRQNQRKKNVGQLRGKGEVI